MLKTSEYFCSWTRLHISLHISFCSGRLETLEHLFFSCALAKEVWGWATRLFCNLLGDPGFVPSFRTLTGLNFLESFPMATQKLAVYFLKLILYAICHFRKMTRFRKVACTAQNTISLVEFSFKQTCSKKFEFWWRELKLYKFKKHCSIGEAFCRVDCLDRLVFTFS